MPEEEQDVDLTGTLGTIAESLKSYKKQESTGKAGWIAAGIATVLALISVAVLAYQAFKSGKERAKRLHEAAVKKEQAHQAEVDADIAEDQATIEEALAAAESLKAEAEDLADKAEALEAARVAMNMQIDKITSWEDVDALLDRE